MNFNIKEVQNYLCFLVFSQGGDHRTKCSSSIVFEQKWFFSDPGQTMIERKIETKKAKKKLYTFMLTFFNRS